eukprot:COSAG06_NODE_519_length_14752_cov_130.649840_14_plen_65_part_00
MIMMISAASTSSSVIVVLVIPRYRYICLQDMIVYYLTWKSTLAINRFCKAPPTNSKAAISLSAI